VALTEWGINLNSALYIYIYIYIYIYVSIQIEVKLYIITELARLRVPPTADIYAHKLAACAFVWEQKLQWFTASGQRASSFVEQH